MKNTSIPRDLEHASGPLAATVLLSALMLACSCSEDPAAATSSSSAGTGGQGVGSSTTTGGFPTSGSAGQGATGGVPTPQPCPGYDGWETWDDYAPDGEFCVPASTDALPPPIEWEPCPASVGMPTGCRQMAITWPTETAIGSSVFGWVDGQSVALSFFRNEIVGSTVHRTFVAVEADGPTTSAMKDMNGVQTPTWALWSPAEGAMRQGKFILYISQFAAPAGMGKQAALGGDAGELHPGVLQTWQDLTFSHSLGAASDFWLARGVADVYIGDWGSEAQLVHTSTQGNGGTLDGFFPFGDFLVWQDDVYPPAALWAYKKGTRAAFPLIPFDPNARLEAFGTDGTHMVWVRTQGFKNPYDATPFEDSIRDIMASPYSETTAGVQPQRLRSYPSIYGLIPNFTVGCGYAAHGGVEPGEAILVRLSDGYSWMLPMADCTPPSTANEFCVAEAVAVTCDEVFVRVEGTHNIARLSIDALGPPVPPD